MCGAVRERTIAVSADDVSHEFFFWIVVFSDRFIPHRYQCLVLMPNGDLPTGVNAVCVAMNGSDDSCPADTNKCKVQPLPAAGEWTAISACKMMNSAVEMMDIALEMTDIALKRMDFVLQASGSSTRG